NLQRSLFTNQQEFERFKNEALLQLKRDQLQAELALLVADGRKEDEVRIAQVQKALSDIEVEFQNAKEKVRRDPTDTFLMTLFGINEDQLGDLKSALGEALDNITGFFDGLLDVQQQNTAARIRSIDDELKTTEDAVAKQKALAEEGKANSLKAEEERAAQLKIQREKALKEQERLRRREVILDSLSQASSLAAAGAKIFNAEAWKGAVGVATSIGTILGMLAFMAKIRAQLRSTTQLRKGASGEFGFIHGRSHEAGGERFLDHIEVEKGEAWSVYNRAGTRKYREQIQEFTKAVNTGTLERQRPFMPLTMQIVRDGAASEIGSGKGEGAGMKRELEEANLKLAKIEKRMANRPESWNEGTATVVRKGAHIRRIRRA
ncbi:MAG: hypothetical protein JNM00_09180, partial [Flavobacteriales bacterium]|nr:hypothetical protein [Flavobacteriales bacterium]